MTFLKNPWPLLLAFLAIGFTACNDDDMDDPVVPEPQTISELAANTPELSSLVAALTDAGLVSVLDGNGPFTVFAPNNDAFDAASATLSGLTQQQVTDVLLYHVIGGASLPAAAIQDGQTYVTTAAETGPDGEQLSMLIEKDGSSVTVNGDVDVVTADVAATNGTIHIVDEIILPPNVVMAAMDNPSIFSELVTALGAAADLDDGASIIDALNGDGPFTVFAPNNAAFADAPAGLTAEQLRNVLLYHVVSGNVDSGEIPASAETLLGQTLNFDGTSISDTTTEPATITFTDVQTTNGIVHVIDKVLIPAL